MSDSAAEELPIVRARARDRLRGQLHALTETPPELQLGDIPRFEDPAERCWWIAERLANGTYRTSDLALCAEAWGVTKTYVEVSYARTAALFTRMVTEDVESLARMAALKIAKLSQAMDVDPRIQHDASKTLLQLTGHLKGGREQPELSGAERDTAIVAWLRDPDDHGVALIREALAAPGPGLVAVLEEWMALNAKGEER